MRELVLDGVRVDDDSEPYVIAEVGHNHQGDLDTAKTIFRLAADSGANAVKLQKRDNRALFTREMYDSPYQSENAYGPTYGTHRDALEFGMQEYLELKKYAEELQLTFFATPFDVPSVEFLEQLGVPLYKIASACLNDTTLLEAVAGTGKPVIVSTGGSTMEDVQRAYDTIMPINEQLCICQCTASYPVEAEDMNLKVISTLRERFPELVIGLSDHQSGIAMALVAYVLGARIFEKHFTVNRAWRGTDHAFSLEHGGLTRLVRDLKRARQAMGDGVKRVLACEEGALFKMGKKLVAARPLAAGTVLSREDIAVKSPSDGLPPYELPKLLGRELTRALGEEENLRFEDLVAP